jgi:hypothetical protein
VEKLCYGIWRAADQELEPVERALVDEVGPALLDTHAHGVRVLVEEPRGAILRVGAQPGSGNLLCGSVSIWLDSLDERAEAEAIISNTPAVETHGWLVTESIPLGYGENRTWPDGERSPGISITTVFDKKDGLADEDFYRIWHGEHTPLSFVIHPLWLYVRNAVVRPVTESAMAPAPPAIRSYVYEATPAFEDMLDFHRFFGSGGDNATLKTNIDRVNNHMATFAETSTLQCTPMAEYVFRTLST